MERDGDMLDQLWHRLSALYERIDRRFKVRDRFETVRGLCIQYPIITICVTSFLAICSIPLICFVAFASISMAIAFCGFMFVEGKV